MSLTPTSFSQLELIQVLDQTAVQGCLAWRVWPELEVHEEPELCWIGCSDPFPIFNVVLKARMKHEKADQRIDALVADARRRNVSLGWYTTPCTRPSDMGGHLLSRGFVLGGVIAGMAADLSALEEGRPLPSDLVIEEVGNLESLKAWCRVMTSVFEFPESAADSWFRLHSSMGLGEDKPWHHYLAWMNGRPVATSSLFMGPDAAMLASVATVSDARRQGIGTAVTRKALHEASVRGYSIAVICSSDMGKDVYLQMGFEEICEMCMYFWCAD